KDFRCEGAANTPVTAGNDIAHASHGHPLLREGQHCVTWSSTTSRSTRYRPTMPIDPNAIGATTDANVFEWTDRDTLLYALGVGAGIDDLAFTTENSHDIPQQVL